MKGCAAATGLKMGQMLIWLVLVSCGWCEGISRELKATHVAYIKYEEKNI